MALNLARCFLRSDPFLFLGLYLSMVSPNRKSTPTRGAFSKHEGLSTEIRSDNPELSRYHFTTDKRQLSVFFKISSKVLKARS